MLIVRDVCVDSGVRVDDQWEAKRTMGESDETVASQITFPEVSGSGSGEFIGSWSDQRSGFSIVQSQKTCATDVKPAETRRHAKPYDCATPCGIHNHLPATQQGMPANHGQISAARSVRHSSACQTRCLADSESQCVGSSSSSIRRF